MATAPRNNCGDHKDSIRKNDAMLAYSVAKMKGISVIVDPAPL